VEFSARVGIKISYTFKLGLQIAFGDLNLQTLAGVALTTNQHKNVAFILINVICVLRLALIHFVLCLCI
jgi:hypothetical protein